MEDTTSNIMVDRPSSQSRQAEPYGNIEAEMRDGVNTIFPIYRRKYTMTHSDETGELFVVVGKDFAKERITPTRDEVMMGFEREGKILAIVGSVLVDGDTIPESFAKTRYEIFKANMPTAIMAIRTADQAFFEQHPFLDQIRVMIWYKSTQPEFNHFYDYGPIGNYVANM